MFIANLATADVLIGLFAIPFQFQVRHHHDNHDLGDSDDSVDDKDGDHGYLLNMSDNADELIGLFVTQLQFHVVMIKLVMMVLLP